MEKVTRVCFDFDDTLDRDIIQGYARELIERGIEVWICTMRPKNLTHWLGYDGHKKPWFNDWDLYPIAETLGIKREHIIFTGMSSKPPYIKDKNFVWLLDDDDKNVREVTELTNCIGVSSMQVGWKEECERILNR